MAPIEGTEASIASLTSTKWDAIIAGGGLSGLVLASRLSEVPGKRILVIEAGASHLGDPRVDTPGLMATLWEDPEYDWGFWSEPQKHLDGREIPQPRGKLLGGSSAVNYTAMVYPTRYDFEAWTALGNNGWTFKDMSPYYTKFHTFFPGSQETRELLSLDSYMNPKLQGTTGPLPVTFTDAYGPFNAAWHKTFDALGYNDSNDPIGGKKMGAFSAPNSIDPNGNKRAYSASYYNSDVAQRPNLTVLTRTSVEKVILDAASTKTAKGVQVLGTDGSQHTILGEQVILCAGTFQSPQILELSGIGSSAILEPLGIQVEVNNPNVGENLQDHYFSSVSFEVADGQISGDVLRDPAVIDALLKQYQETQAGPFSGMPISMSYMPPMGPDGILGNPAIQGLFEKHLDKDLDNERGLKEQYAELRRLVLEPRESTVYFAIVPSQFHCHPTKTTMSQAMEKILPGNYISLMAGLNHPFSRGSVHVTSKETKKSPRIDPNYLSHPLDLQFLAHAIQFLEKIVQQSPLKELLKPESRIPANADLSNLDVTQAIAKERLYTTFHPACTCAMLPREAGGVVDDKLRVYGTANLRVVDASIFPMITLGNIQSTVYAVAEKAADLIKGEWASQSNGAPKTNGIPTANGHPKANGV